MWHFFSVTFLISTGKISDNIVLNNTICVSLKQWGKNHGEFKNILCKNFFITDFIKISTKMMSTKLKRYSLKWDENV